MTEPRESRPGVNECGERVNLIIQDALSQVPSAMAFRQELRAVTSQWLKQIQVAPTSDALALLACAANGGNPCTAAPVTAAWQLLRLSAKLLDDAEDRSVGDDFPFHINVATGLLVGAHLALASLPSQISVDRAWRISQALDDAVLKAAAGQHADLKASYKPEGVVPEGWLEIARAKSGALFGWAAWAGAVVAGAEEQVLESYREYGTCLGVLVQVADDLNDVWKPDRSGDLATGELSLPISFAQHVANREEREYLGTLLKRAQAGDRDAESQVRQLLIDLGAPSYLLVVARLQYRQAVEALERARSIPGASQPLVDLLEQVLPALSLIRSIDRIRS